ncbi:FecCD family ABC transporter permease [Paenibacillus glufosinatiresistens]|uniref:FecCD family ABC transporter permease n=1 Tax=Paenibacillus glufosinatiresistens TaxID=3070657 RepID=UPI00286E277C|nr:iron ABC transporter permease [Paenibacillus sp. YX.27]
MVHNSASIPHTSSTARPDLRSRPRFAWFILAFGFLALLLAMAVSIAAGAVDIDLGTVMQALLRYQPELQTHVVIREIRLPRTIAGALVGACLAVAGAMMQGMTRNPLADSGLLGLNAGGGAAMAAAFAFLPSVSFWELMLFSFAGAAVAALVVFGVGSLSFSGLTPLRLTLAGAAVSALLSAVSQGIALMFNLSQDLAFWYAGGVAGATWDQLRLMAPWSVGGLVAALLMARPVTVLSLGSDVASGLGQRTGLVQAIGLAIVTILAGTAVAAVGPVAFLGLIVPHLVRFLVGLDYRWIIPCSAVLGALLLVAADTAARLVSPPYETPVGALIALIGVPFFFVLARRERGSAR